MGTPRLSAPTAGLRRHATRRRTLSRDNPCMTHDSLRLRTTQAVALVALAAMAALAASPGQAQTAPRLPAPIEKALVRARVPRDAVSMLVVEAGSGKPVPRLS